LITTQIQRPRRLEGILSSTEPLSPRQHEVLRLLADGMRAREIGVKLGLSEATVRNHIRGVLRRLESHSQLQAVARAREQRLL
jgi:DNA-binding CsgD family transcriptional regulator